jgi:hypothetical protein
MKFYTLNENRSNLRGRSLYNSVDDSLSAMELDAYVNRFYSDDNYLVISVGRSVSKREVEDIVFPYGYAYYDAGANDDRLMLTFQRVSTVGESMSYRLTEGKFVNNKKGYFEVAIPGDDSAHDGEYPEIPALDNYFANRDENTVIEYTYDEKLEKLRDELENLYYEVEGEYPIDVESEDSYINVALYNTPKNKFDLASYTRICRDLIKKYKSKLQYPIKEEFGIDFADTLAWVEKKRPDLSRGAQIKFARNIIAKRQREAISALPPTPPSTTGIGKVRPGVDPTGILDGVTKIEMCEHCGNDLIIVFDITKRTHHLDDIIYIGYRNTKESSKWEELMWGDRKYLDKYWIVHGSVSDYSRITGDKYLNLYVS